MTEPNLDYFMGTFAPKENYNEEKTLRQNLGQHLFEARNSLLDAAKLCRDLCMHDDHSRRCEIVAEIVKKLISEIAAEIRTTEMENDEVSLINVVGGVKG